MKGRGAGWMLLSSVMFAGMAVSARVLSGQMSTGQLVCVRFAVGLVGLGAVFVMRGYGPRAPRKGPWLLRGLFGGAAGYGYFYAIETLGVGPATLLNYAAPCWAAAFAVLFLRERPTAHLIGGLLVATAGAMVVAVSTAPPDRPFALGPGAWAGIASALMSGASMTAVRGLRRDTDTATIFFGFCLFGFLIGIPGSVADWRPLTALTLGMGVAVGVFSFAAQMLFTWAFKFVTASAGSAMMQLTPALAWVAGVVLLDEEVRALTVIGAVMCMLGVLWGATLGAPKGEISAGSSASS